MWRVLLAWFVSFREATTVEEARASLGMGSLATQDANALTLGGNADADGYQVKNVGDATDNGDAPNLLQVNNLISNAVTSKSWKNAVVAAQTGVITGSYTYDNGADDDGIGATITASSNGAFPSQDGVNLSEGDRFLVWKETAGNAKVNGPYTLTSTGDAGSPWVLTRATDADSAEELLPNSAIPVSQGGTYSDKILMLTTNGPITIGTTSLSFTVYSATVDNSTMPNPLGTASPGVSSSAAPADHVHAHGTIASGDLHTEYAKADGSRAFTNQVSTAGRKLSKAGVTSSTTVVATKDVQMVSCHNADVILTMVAATGDGTEVCVKRYDTSNPNAHTLTLQRDGSDTIEDEAGADQANITLNNRDSIRLTSLVSGKWMIIA